MVLMVLLVATVSFPFFGYIQKRWKGAAIGCALMPIACVILSTITVVGIAAYQRIHLHKQRKDAMVVVKKTTDKGYSDFWYLKTNDDCFYEYKEKENSDVEYTGFDRAKHFDVVPLDSCSVEVDDKIVVKFDLEHQKATASEYDEPIEVVNVDWERVNEYFKNLPKYKNPE